MKAYKILQLLILAVFIAACNSGPKVISSPVNPSKEGTSTGIFDEDSQPINESQPVVSDNVHTVKVIEVLPTKKYIYLRVDEAGEEFWIATSKKEVQVGETYFYKNGILKTNFESKEHNRIFDKVYLVANIVSANHGIDPPNKNTNSIEPTNQISVPQQIAIEGSIKIADLVKNKIKYENKEVQVSGQCTKLNPNIMGRNWIHLKDGSMDDFDLVITSDIAVPEGHHVTLKGTLVLDKDFGAGYTYTLLIENGQIVTSN